MTPMKKGDLNAKMFDVHLFPVLQIKVPGVEATSHIAAVEQAVAQTDLYAECESTKFEYAEEFSHFLVDVTSDQECENSRWFYSQDNPLLANLRRLVKWYDQGMLPDELDAIIKSARDALSVSV